MKRDIAHMLVPTDHEAGSSCDRGPILLLVAGEGFISTHEIGDHDVVIGRNESCDVVVQHCAFSRRHAIIRRGSPSTVQDMGSVSGTRIGGDDRRGGAPSQIKFGETFGIGPYVFILIRAVHAPPSFIRPDVLRIEDPTLSAGSSLLKDLAAGCTSILISGETGVGKEVLAAALHRLSDRGSDPVRFAGGSRQLDVAPGGTVILDNVDQLPPISQAWLRGVIEHQRGVQFIAIAGRDLPREVTAGRFRSDLYALIHGVTLFVPPLRERAGCIGRLAMRFLRDAFRDSPQVWLSADALAKLQAYRWPGNVRELRSVMAHTASIASMGRVSACDLPW